MNNLACIICRFPHIDLEGVKDQWTFYKCPRCGYMRVEPLPTESELNQLYDEDYGKTRHLEDYIRLREQRQIQYNIDANHLNQFTKSTSILDFGCGDGSFLSSAKIFGNYQELWGYDINRVELKHPHIQRLNHLEDIRYGYFETVVMRGVIEHLRNPRRTLNLLLQKMSKGSIFYICATPNVDSPAYLRFGLDWHMVCPPYHIHYFSPRTLASLLAEYGFVIRDIRLDYENTPYANFPYDSMNYLSRELSVPLPGSMMSAVFEKCR